MAVTEVVVQLQRLEELRFVTANKGLTAAYTLDEFFNEQARSAIANVFYFDCFPPCRRCHDICCAGLEAISCSLLSVHSRLKKAYFEQYFNG